MSNATQLAWAAVRECNEAIKAARTIIALPLADDWRTIKREDWIEFTRCLETVANRHEHNGASGSDFREYHSEFTTGEHHGKVEREMMEITMEALEIHHTALMYIYEGTK